MCTHGDWTGRVQVGMELSIKQGKGREGSCRTPPGNIDNIPGRNMPVVSTYSLTVASIHIVHLVHSTGNILYIAFCRDMSVWPLLSADVS